MRTVYEIPQETCRKIGVKDFEDLFQKYRMRIFRICLRECRNVALAEEFTQDVFVLLVRKIATYKGASRFSTWLHEVARNVARAGLRNKYYHCTISLEEQMENNGGRGGSHRMEIELGNEMPQWGATTIIDRLALCAAIEKLPQARRRIFSLREIEGYSHVEIAEILGLDPGTSRSQFYKACRFLREALPYEKSIREKTH